MKEEKKLYGLVDLREDKTKPIIGNPEERQKFLEEHGTKVKLTDGFLLTFIGGDWFLISPTGDCKLLLCWTFNETKNRKWVETTRYIHVDKGIREDEKRGMNR